MARLAAVPEGSTNGIAADRRYMVTKTLFSSGRSVKLVAKELGGSDYISLNVYHLSSGPRLIPCEMSRTKVLRFLLTLLLPDQDAA